MTPPRGYIGLAIGQNRVPVSFGRFVLPDFVFEYHYVENKVDDPPIFIRADPGDRILTDGNITGCWLELSAAPDTANYVLQWGLAA